MVLSTKQLSPSLCSFERQYLLWERFVQVHHSLQKISKEDKLVISLFLLHMSSTDGKWDGILGWKQV